MICRGRYEKKELTVKARAPKKASVLGVVGWWEAILKKNLNSQIVKSDYAKASSDRVVKSCTQRQASPAALS